MKNLLQSGLAKKVLLFAFIVGVVSPSAMAYQFGGTPDTSTVAAVAPVVQNLTVVPATGSATISFSVNTNATTTVWVKDSSDNIVKTVSFDQPVTGGVTNTLNWNGTNSNGTAVSSGNYKAQVVTYNTASSDIKSYSFNYTAGSTVTAPTVNVSVNPTSFEPSKGQSTVVTYSLSQPASLGVVVKLNGSTIKTLREQTLQSVGTYNLTWDGKNTAGTEMGVNTYTVEVYASNVAGNDTKTANVSIVNNTPTVTAPNITNVYANPTPFNPNSENTRVYFTLDKTATVNVDVVENSNTNLVKNLVSGVTLSAGTYSYEWNGKNTSGNTVANGTYRARVTASNSAGSDTEFTSVEVNAGSTSTAPNITNLYAAPTPFNPNNENTRVYFNVDKTANVTVDIMDGSSTVRNLVSGTTLSAGSYFYEWNGRNSSGNIVSDRTYTARVTASNSSGSDTESTSVEVRTSSTGSCDLVTSHFVNPTSFNPEDRDAQIYFTMSRTAEVTLRIKKGSTIVKTLLSNSSQTSGQKIISWNGKDSDGDVVDDGSYTYEIKAYVSGCSEDIESSTVRVVNDDSDNDDDYENDWPSTDEDLVQDLVVRNEVFDPRDGERSTVEFELTRRADLKVQVLDGNRVVRTLRNVQNQSSGDYSYDWDGRDNDGDRVSDDVYTFRVMADDGDDTDTDRAYVEVDTDGVLIGFPDSARCAGFKDVSVNSPFCKAIELMSKKKIFTGYSDGTFRPYERINRAETAKVVVLALDYDVETSGYFGRQYNDTIANAWYAPYLEVAKRNDIATGYPDGSFRPASTINRVELLRVFLEANRLSLSTCSPQPFEDTPISKDTDWYMKYACYAKYNGLMNSEYSNKLYPAEAMTRGDVADLFYDFEVKGLYDNYDDNRYDDYNYNNNNDDRYCVDYDTYNDECERYVYADSEDVVCTLREGSKCVEYDVDNYYSSSNNDDEDGYYVYRNGRYVWVAY